MDINTAIRIIRCNEYHESPLDIVDAIAYIITSKNKDLPDDIADICNRCVLSNIVSSEGEVLIDEETIWNLFGENQE